MFNSKEFKEKYHYEGELGAIYSKDKTIFKIWAPTSEKVELVLYKEEKEVLPLVKGEKGLWSLELEGDLHGTYYNYVNYGHGWKHTLTDPYAKAVSVNGHKAMVVDLKRTNPLNWEKDLKPELNNVIDSIIYEVHIRDFSIDENSGVSDINKGKFLGMCENGTHIPKKETKTGVDHLKELGITHVHLLPSFDYGSVDECRLDEPQYNWGYDPTNYNVPEGSYSTNPYNGDTRIFEFKKMVKKLHENDIRVVMDVVYNHTFSADDSNINKAVPGYYHRQDESGEFSNGSGCGNELASDRSMVRKYMVDSLVYWAKEYHIDGFRFDLMALHDIKTLKLIREELDKVDPSIIIYGEGWIGGDSPLPKEEACFKCNTKEYGEMQIAAFSDDMRDGIKGHVANQKEAGFVNGGEDFEESIKFGVVASVKHNDIDYSKVNYSEEPWAIEPYQTVNYASAHDNNTLWDKLQIVSPKASEEEIKEQNKLAAAIVLTSQGISFIHAGEELARTKIDEKGSFVENSYCSSDKVNKIEWLRKEQYNDIFKYYQGLIALRKVQNIFRLRTSEEIRKYIKFLSKGVNFEEDNIIAYEINRSEKTNSWDKVCVIYNANNKDVKVKLPGKDWVVVADKNKAGVDSIKEVNGNEISVEKKSCLVLVKKEEFIK